MEKKALFLGAIGTLVETSELQRQAFNRAFVTSGVDWYWDKRMYAKLLQSSGGQNRISSFADQMGETVDAQELHALKVNHYAELIAQKGLSLRPGVKGTLEAAKNQGWMTAFVTSTGKDQSQAIFDALGDELSADDFNYIGSADRVAQSKPAPDIYNDALQTLGLAAAEVIAVEDSPSSAAAALAAGIDTYVTPGDMHTGHEFPEMAIRIDTLDPSLVQQQQMAAE